MNIIFENLQILNFQDEMLANINLVHFLHAT